ncbi:arginase family protein [Winogradskyella maritima]|nr:arginase family protein [Winogradskyella maritima]
MPFNLCKILLFKVINWDAKSSFQKGPAKAPKQIRKALYSDSMNLYSELGTSIEHQTIVDAGDYVITDYFDIESITKNNFQKKTAQILTLGGDHSVTFSNYKSVSRFYPKLDILHIDAHADLYHAYDGDPYSHACPFARIMENGLCGKTSSGRYPNLKPTSGGTGKKFNVELHEMAQFGYQYNIQIENPVYISWIWTDLTLPLPQGFTP